jgi:transcriptional regulator with XRE-family HTH domain
MSDTRRSRGTSVTGEMEEVLENVGPRLKALRLERGATLSTLAATTGISVSTLSRLESGQRKPTLELLLPLARAHQVPLDELVDAPETGDPRVHAKPIKRHGQTIIPLTRRPGGLQAYKLVIPPRHPAERDRRLRTHEGYEWLYVLSGSLHLHLGAKVFDLGPGEVVEFDTRVPHLVANHAAAPAEVLALFGPQGERMHVRND